MDSKRPKAKGARFHRIILRIDGGAVTRGSPSRRSQVVGEIGLACRSTGRFFDRKIKQRMRVRIFLSFTFPVVETIDIEKLCAESIGKRTDPSKSMSICERLFFRSYRGQQTRTGIAFCQTASEFATIELQKIGSFFQSSEACYDHRSLSNRRSPVHSLVPLHQSMCPKGIPPGG